jgi:rhamnulokinase
MLMIPDWLHFILCGERAVEFTNATTTQFLDPIRRDWSRGLLDRLGLPNHPLGPLVEPGTRLGQLRPAVASVTGASSLSVVAPATHDTGSAVIGVPTDRTGHRDWAYISSGTWSLVGLELPAPLLTPEALAVNVTNEGGYAGTWRLLRNVMGLWLVQGCRQTFQAAGSSLDYAALVRRAAESPAWRSVVDPNHTRFLKPDNMVTELQQACAETGQPVPASEGEIVRCCLDSLALKYADVLARLESLTGTRVVTVHVVGGGARNALLNQLTADATGVRVVAGPAEATVLGNLAVQLATDGEWGGLDDMRRHLAAVEPLQEFHPDPSGHLQALEAAARWRLLHAAHAGASL